MGKLKSQGEPWQEARSAVFELFNRLKNLDEVGYYKLMLSVGAFTTDQMVDQMTLKAPEILDLLAKSEKIPVMYGPHSDYKKSAELIVEKLGVGKKALIRQNYKTKSISIIDTEKTDNLKNRLARAAITTIAELREKRPSSDYRESVKYLKSLKIPAKDIKHMLANLEDECIYSEELLDRISELSNITSKASSKDYEAWAECAWEVLLAERDGKIPRALLDKAAYAENYALQLGYRNYADIPAGTKLSKVRTRTKMEFRRLVKSMLKRD